MDKEKAMERLNAVLNHQYRQYRRRMHYLRRHLHWS